MAVRMTIMAGSMKDQAFLLEQSRIKIGRGPNGVDFVLDEPSISKVHAQIDIIGDQIRVQDLESRNGIRVGGKAVSKIRMRKGVVHIGKIPVKFEFEDAAEEEEAPVAVAPEPEAAELVPTEAPKVEEVKWQDDGDGEDYLPAKDKEKEVGKTGTLVAYVLLTLVLFGLIAYVLKDFINPPVVPLASSRQFTFNINTISDPLPFRVKLPGVYGGQRTEEYYNAHFSTSTYSGMMAENSKKLFLIYPIKEEEEGVGKTIYIKLADGRTFALTVKIHEDDTKIDKPKIMRMEDKHVSAMYQILEKKELARPSNKWTFEEQRDVWKQLKRAIDSSREYKQNFDEFQDIKNMKKRLDRLFEEKREQLYKAARNEADKFSDNNGQSYLNEAIRILEGVMEFTDEQSHDYSRYQFFLLHLTTMKKKFTKKR
jgi:hypothetical protein